MEDNLPSAADEVDALTAEVVRIAKVAPPFDERGADTILRTPDGAQFRVSRIILILVSPIFRGMFEIPQPPRDLGLPVIDMTEDSRTLDMLLRLCYPGENPKIQNLADAMALLEVARKYEITMVKHAAQKRFREIALASPTKTWAITTRAGRTEEARFAARMTLRFPAFSGGRCTELAYVSGLDHHDLIQYHRNCEDVAKGWIASWTWKAGPMISRCVTSGGFSISARNHWIGALKARLESILKATPCGDLIDTAEMQAICIEGAACKECRKTVFAESRAVLAAAAEAVEAAIDTVPYGV